MVHKLKLKKRRLKQFSTESYNMYLRGFKLNILM